MPTPGKKTPELSVPLLGGGRWELSAQSPDNFTIIVFYRGKHCPICKTYLEQVEAAMDDFAGIGCHFLAVSMDEKQRAQDTWDEVGLGKLPFAYGMSMDQAKDWDLYLSSKREGSQEPDVFSEPALAVVRADGTLFFIQHQNAPFTRPPLDQLRKGLGFTIDNDYPTRGTYQGA